MVRMDPVKLAMDVRNNQTDLQDFVKELHSWTEDMKKNQVDTKNPAASKPKAVSEDVCRLKESGNAFLKKQQYDKALKQYTAAMDMDPEYAVLPANRAMAQLKLNNFKAAEGDCSLAIRLDPSYVKAYLRRASARVKLGKSQEARKDFCRVLAVEPSNRDAKAGLKELETATVEKVGVASDKPASLKKVTGRDGGKDDGKKTRKLSPVESGSSNGKISRNSDCRATKSAVELEQKTGTRARAHRYTDASLVDVEIKRFDGDAQMDQYIASLLPQDTKTVNPEDNVVKSDCVSVKQSEKVLDVATSEDPAVHTLNSPRKLDECPLKETISVKIDSSPLKLCSNDASVIPADLTPPSDASAGDSHTPDTIKPESRVYAASKGDTLSPTDEPSSTTSDSPNDPSDVACHSAVTNGAVGVPSAAASQKLTNGCASAPHHASSSDQLLQGRQQSLPPPPKSSYQLLADWKLLKSRKYLLAQYLKAIPHTEYRSIFRESLDDRILVDILKVMKTWDSDDVAPRLNALADVRRIDMLVMFLGSSDKECLVDMLDKCSLDGCDVAKAVRCFKV